MFNPQSEAFINTPNKVFSEMRSTQPIYVHQSEGWRFISIFSYVDAKFILNDADVWSSEMPEISDLVPADASIRKIENGAAVFVKKKAIDVSQPILIKPK